MRGPWNFSFLISMALGYETHLKDLVRSECLVITNSPSWIHDGPLIRVEDAKILQEWDKSLGITAGTSCLDIVFFGSWDISSLEPWKGIYQDYSIINLVDRGDGFHIPTIPVQVKVYDRGWIHQFCPNHGWQFNASLFGGPNNRLIKPIPKCPNSLTDQHFNISAIGISPPDVVFDEKGEIVGGTALDVFNIMAQKFHFSYSIMTESYLARPAGNSGEWLGLIGNVKNGTSAFGVGFIFVDHSFSKIVDYLETLVFYPVNLRSKKPSRLSANKNLVRPFSTLVWIMILGILPFIVFVLITFKYFEHVRNRSDLISHGFMAFRIFLGQSGNLASHNGRSSKIFLGFWIMSVLFLSSIYECNLRAYLMYTPYEKPIETEQDIVDRGRNLYLPFGTPFLSYYRESELEIRRQLWSKIDKNPNLLYYAAIASCFLKHEKVDLIENGGVDLQSRAFFYARYPIMKAMYGYQPFYISKKAVFELQFSMMLKKYQDHRRDLNRIVRHLQAAGIVDHLSDGYLSQEALIGQNLDNTPQPFTLEHFTGAFVILGMGLVVSGMTLLNERFRTRK